MTFISDVLSNVRGRAAEDHLAAVKGFAESLGDNGETPPSLTPLQLRALKFSQGAKLKGIKMLHKGVSFLGAGLGSGIGGYLGLQIMIKVFQEFIEPHMDNKVNLFNSALFLGSMALVVCAAFKSGQLSYKLTRDKTKPFEDAAIKAIQESTLGRLNDFKLKSP